MDGKQSFAHSPEPESEDLIHNSDHRIDRTQALRSNSATSDNTVLFEDTLKAQLTGDNPMFIRTQRQQSFMMPRNKNSRLQHQLDSCNVRS